MSSLLREFLNLMAAYGLITAQVHAAESSSGISAQTSNKKLLLSHIVYPAGT